MRFIVGGLGGGIAGGVLSAVLSFGLLLLYCWAKQPGGNLGSSTWAAGVGNFYFTVALPLAVVLGAVICAAAVVLFLIIRDFSRE
ncbi:MAG: hypothetical protein M3552_12310 [Planctomycetota bacterium]|nr:hypothetical protein [Planctomycetaceae bacterium]MDQ3331417.1 hypothetical protein [Planctomycetota bacterium]